jgi:hypothetical protein
MWIRNRFDHDIFLEMDRSCATDENKATVWNTMSADSVRATAWKEDARVDSFHVISSVSKRMLRNWDSPNLMMNDEAEQILRRLRGPRGVDERR